ncbi:polysaccharide pyruvyl transferase family protein [Pedobacter sp. P26]|uniref:polysaccharide pyruvyl transferase family protein n=1 Tax=Pedobacter sp. P26 TaxID=3423956 RepID=UPI003D67B742
MINYYYNYYKKFARSLLVANRPRKNASDYASVGLVNTSIGTTNLGDIIIFDAVYKHLREVYPDAFLTHYPSQIHRDYDARLSMAGEDVIFVGGTNLLSSNMQSRYQWKIDPLDKFFLKNKVVLMGVGWWQYQSKPDNYTKALLKSILSDKYQHSVRDSYTKEMLNSIGINNVINTTCPTLWELSPEKCNVVNRLKAKDVVTTLTFYKRDDAADLKLLNLLMDNYENVYLWVQGIDDVGYLKELLPDSSRITLVSPSIEAYNEILSKDNIEYLGTRLHAGVRAIQRGVRTLIVAVDNRAIEIGKDTNLNVIERSNLDLAYEFINNSYSTDIKLPNENIMEWKKQFKS